jgi:hypothetical protein
VTSVIGPGVRVLVTDAAMRALGHPRQSVVLTVWHLLDQHGGRRTPAEYDVGPLRLRVEPRRDGALVVGLREEQAA